MVTEKQRIAHFDENVTADAVLDAVDRWSTGYELLRELGDVFTDSYKRLDGLLLPMSHDARCMKRQTAGPGYWDRPVLYGVEVKRTRADFLAGLRRNQFAEYAKHLGGLYLACPKHVCRTDEIPLNVGHLVVTHRTGKELGLSPSWGYHTKILTKRHPQFQEMEYPSVVLWRLLFRARTKWARVDRYRERSDEAILGKLRQAAATVVDEALAALLREARCREAAAEQAAARKQLTRATK